MADLKSEINSISGTETGAAHDGVSSALPSALPPSSGPSSSGSFVQRFTIAPRAKLPPREHSEHSATPTASTAPGNFPAAGPGIQQQIPGTEPQSSLEEAQKTLDAVKKDYAKKLEQSEKNVKRGESRIHGSEKQIETDTKEIEKPFWRKALSFVFTPLAVYDIADYGTNKRIAQGIESDKKLLAQQKVQFGAVKGEYDSAVALRQQVADFETRSAKLLAEGKAAEAEALIRSSAAALKAAAPLLGGKRVAVTTEEHSRTLAEISQGLEDHVRHIGYAETAVRTVRNTAIATGVVIGTAGVGTGAVAIGGGITATGWTAGVGFTTLGATAAGGLGNLTEAIGHTAVGTKDAGQAFKDAGTQTLQDGKDNLINSISTAIGFRAGGNILGVVQRGVVTAVSRSAASTVAHGVIDPAIAEKFEWPSIEERLDSRISPMERDQIHEQWKRSRGHTVEQLFRNGLIDLGVSAVLGGGGAQATALTQQITSTGTRIATVAAVDSTMGTVVGTGAGMLKAGLDGRQFTGEDFVREVSGSVAASVAGNLSQAFQTRKEPPSPDRSGDGSGAKPPKLDPDNGGSDAPQAKKGVVEVLNSSPLEVLRTIFSKMRGAPAAAIAPAAGEQVADGAIKTDGAAQKTAASGETADANAPAGKTAPAPATESDRTAAAKTAGNGDGTAPKDAKDGVKPGTPSKTDEPAPKANEDGTAPKPAEAVAAASAAEVPKGPWYERAALSIRNLRIRLVNTLAPADRQVPLRGPGGTDAEPETLKDFAGDRWQAWKVWQNKPRIRYSIDLERVDIPLYGPVNLSWLGKKGLITQRDGVPKGVDPDKVVWVGDKIHDGSHQAQQTVRSVPVIGPIIGLPTGLMFGMIRSFITRDAKLIPPEAFPGGNVYHKDALRDRGEWNRDQTHPNGYASPHLPKWDPWWARSQQNTPAPAASAAPATSPSAGVLPAASSLDNAARTFEHGVIVNAAGAGTSMVGSRSLARAKNDLQPDQHYAEITFGSPGQKRQSYTLGYDPAKLTAGKIMEAIEASRSANPLVEVKVRFISGQNAQSAGNAAATKNQTAGAEAAASTPAPAPTDSQTEAFKNGFYGACPNGSQFVNRLPAPQSDKTYVIVEVGDPSIKGSKERIYVENTGTGTPSDILKALAKQAEQFPQLEISGEVITGTGMALASANAKARQAQQTARRKSAQKSTTPATGPAAGDTQK